MSTLLIILIIVFVVGYLFIALEHSIKIDKTASALLLGMLLWIIYVVCADKLIVDSSHFQTYLAEHPGATARDFILNVQIVESLGDITQTLFFLIGAMTIVELVDCHGGFQVITNKITTRKKRQLLWILVGTTFFMSAVLDNLTTTIVMIMLLRKLVADKHERWIFASMIVIAANTGGAWSPIGDVTTIMLWVKGNVTALALIKYVLAPSIVACIIPVFIAQYWLKGSLAPTGDVSRDSYFTTDKEKRTIFMLGVGGLIFVPIFKSITHLPPFVGILFVLALLWIYTEIFYNGRMLERSQEHRLPNVISKIDMPSILFFLGILMAVAVLEHTGLLERAALALDEGIGNVYIINIILGALSSIVDNVPLVAASMGMYPVITDPAMAEFINYGVDGIFWEFLSYCAGVGGSILIIGSAAGVIAMGLEKISFGWYLKRVSLLALVGYLAGAGMYILEALLLK